VPFGGFAALDIDVRGIRSKPTANLLMPSRFFGVFFVRAPR
jgi:hypothetical protein